MRVAVLGAGRIGRVHAQTLAGGVPDAELAAVADVDRAAAENVARALGAEATETAEVLGDAAVDAVIIASSTDTHASLITQAARAGKHIFCEKPIDFDLARIDEALEEVGRAGVKLQIGFNRRFDPNHVRIRKAIDTGEIGKPELLHITSRDPAPPPIDYVRVSGGLFFDMMIHDFDMARFLFGEVSEVFAWGAVLVDREIGRVGDVDTALVSLRFTAGALGVIDNSRRAVYGYDQRVEAFGSAGSARSENWHPDAVTVSSGAGVRRDLPMNFFMDRYALSYREEMRSFVRCVADDTEPAVSGADGRAPVVMARAAELSMRRGRPVGPAEVDESRGAGKG